MKRYLPLYLAVYGFYLVVAVVITYPLIMQFSTHFAGNLPGPGDAYEYARHIWWFKHALQTGQPLFFHPLLAYPDGIPGAHLWANLLQSFPASLFAFVMPLPAAFNLMVLLRLAFNGWAMWFLSGQLLAVSSQLKTKENIEPPRHEGHQEAFEPQRHAWRKENSALSTQHSVLSPHYSSPITHHFFSPALLAGLVYMLFPTAQSHLAASHSGLLVLAPFPLYVYALLRVRAGGGARWYALAALFFVLGCIGSYALALYVHVPLTAFLLLSSVFLRDWRGLRRMVLAVLLGGLASLIFLLPAALEVLNQPQIQFGGTFTFSADLLAFAAPSPQNPLFSALDYPRYILGGGVIEGAGYLGIAASALALIGAIRFRAARGWLLLMIAAWVLSLGPLLKVLDQPAVLRIGGEAASYITLPYALFQNLPLVDIARTPARFNFTVALALSVMAGYGAATLWRWSETVIIRIRRAVSLQILRALIFILLMAWIVFEYQLFFPLPTPRADLPTALYDLANRDDIRAVFDIPWNSTAGKDGLYLQTAHQQPLVAGAVTRGTPVSHAKLWLLQQTLNPALLDAAGVDVIILHRTWAETDAFDEVFTRQQLGQPFYEDERYALFNAPDPAEPAPFIALDDPDSLSLGAWASYLYAPAPGWAAWNGTLRGNEITIEVQVEGSPVHRWTVSGETVVSLPLWLPNAGYYRVQTQLAPACPPDPPPPLRCRSATLDELTIGDFVADADAPVQFERGVSLSASSVPEAASAGDRLPVYLAWQFAEARAESDVRFVHVLDGSGVLVAQVDMPIGAHEAGSQWSEQVDLSLPANLPPGEYRVYAGWYTYPEIVNFCVLENGACAANEALIGTLQIN